MCRQLKCKPETLEHYLKIMGISYSGNRGLNGFSTDCGYKPAKDYIKGTSVKSYELKRKLLRDGIKPYVCERCGNTTWCGRDIPLELHHKDGDHFNNEFSNLELLCPNCHALEPNNSGRGRKKTS